MTRDAVALFSLAWKCCLAFSTKNDNFYALRVRSVT